MTINTKYGIGDKVYAVFKETDKSEIEVCVGTVREILIKEQTIEYYIDTVYEAFEEVDLIPINDKLGLTKRIDELSKEAKNEENK